MEEGGSLNNLEDDSNMLFYSLKELFMHSVSANFVADCSHKVVVIIRVDNNTTYFMRRLISKCNVSHRQNQKK